MECFEICFPQKQNIAIFTALHTCLFMTIEDTYNTLYG